MEVKAASELVGSTFCRAFDGSPSTSLIDSADFGVVEILDRIFGYAIALEAQTFGREMLRAADDVCRSSEELLRCGSFVIHAVANRMSEAIVRSANDRDLLVSVFDYDPTKLAKLAIAGDLHAKHSAVMSFGCGFGSIFYKPRVLKQEQTFYELLAYLLKQTGRELPPCPAVVQCADYSWMASVPQSVTDHPIRAYRRRLGFAAALLVTLRSGDHHPENVLTFDGWPVFVDLECSFVPGTKLDSDLRHIFSLSATNLDGIPATPPRLSTVNSVRNPDLESFWMGYEEGLAAVAANARSRYFRKRLATLSSTKMRLVLRPTKYYADVIQRSWAPALRRTSAARMAFIERCLPIPSSEFIAIREAERTALAQCRIPTFHHLPTGRMVTTDEGQQANVILTPGSQLVTGALPS